MPLLKSTATAALMVLLSQCSTNPQPMRGIIFTNVRGPNQAVASSVPLTKKGESCTKTLFSLWTWGDASIASAKAAGKISEIGAVDYQHLAVLSFIYTHTCTIVTGS